MQTGVGATPCWTEEEGGAIGLGVGEGGDVGRAVGEGNSVGVGLTAVAEGKGVLLAAGPSVSAAGGKLV